MYNRHRSEYKNSRPFEFDISKGVDHRERGGETSVQPSSVKKWRSVVHETLSNSQKASNADQSYNNVTQQKVL